MMRILCMSEKIIEPEDIKEDLIHSMQRFVEVDEPEPDAVPLLSSSPERNYFSRDDQSADVVIDRMTEEELLRGMERSIPSDQHQNSRMR